MSNSTDIYTVWVGGGEINDYPLSLEDAQAVALDYKEQGYDDVHVEKVEVS